MHLKKIMWGGSLLLFLGTQLVMAQAKKSPYVFAYFNGNGEDGLHLAYSYDGYKWVPLKGDKSFLKPTVSVDKLMRDPCIVKGENGLFHMVWTVSWNDKGIGYASSKDLVHWSEQKFIPVMQQEKNAKNCWAPELTYDDKSKTYMIYWATTIEGKFSETASNLENKYNHRLYYVTTKDFITFSDTKLLYDPGFNVIDATIVKNGANFLMFLKDETPEPAQKNLKTSESQSLTGPYSKASEPLTQGYWAEGPTTLKTGDEWIVYFDKYTQHKYGAVRSTDLKVWEDVSDLISVPKGLRHGTIISVKRRVLKKLIKE